MKNNILIFIISTFFVLFSFSPSIYEIIQSKNLSQDRVFVLEHNYMFDYNFYLSRIRQGMEGKWMVTEKYYNQPHKASFLQIAYLYLGKAGKLLNLNPETTYHASRLFFGLFLLIGAGIYSLSKLKGNWGIISFLLIVTASSWPVFMMINGLPRAGTYMGWWSAIDALQRITFIPHVIIGQLTILFLIYSLSFGRKTLLNTAVICLTGLIGGIIFPPAVVNIYAWIFVITIIELGSEIMKKGGRGITIYFKEALKSGVFQTRFLLVIVSSISLIYTSWIFKFAPWNQLPLFDVLHRPILPYKDYILAQGPVFITGLMGALLVILKKVEKFYSCLAWIISVWILFAVFERVPQQSPLRFTESAIHIPLGILSGFLFYSIWNYSKKFKSFYGSFIRFADLSLISLCILNGIFVMWSMSLWLIDQAIAKNLSGWRVVTGVQLAYPLKDFMDPIIFLKNFTSPENTVLSYATAGNYIPAYSGNYVYVGHANTPNEDKKEAISLEFFSGKMGRDKGREFLDKEEIDYIYFGIQEQELSGQSDLLKTYPFLSEIYRNKSVKIYKYNK